MHWSYLLSFLSVTLAPLVIKVLTALGIGLVSYGGINFLLDQIKNQVISSFSEMPLEVLSIMGLLKVDVSINIILSAVTARAILSGMNKGTGTTKKWQGI